MPEISRFYGIIVFLMYDDHNPPHFHARYGEYKITISIKNLEILSGKLPRRGLNLLLDWAELHKKELIEEWNLAKQGRPLFKIEPLR